MKTLAYKQLEQLAESKGYGLKKEICQYTNKTMLVIYLGNHSEGIFTVMKSSNKQNIADKLNRLNKQ